MTSKEKQEKAIALRIQHEDGIITQAEYMAALKQLWNEPVDLPEVSRP